MLSNNNLLEKIELTKLPSASIDNKYLLMYQELHFEINQSLYKHIYRYQEQIKHGKVHDKDRYEVFVHYLDEIIKKKGSSSKSRIDTGFLWYKKKLLSYEKASILTNWLSYLFNKRIFAFVFIFAIILEVAFYTIPKEKFSMFTGSALLSGLMAIIIILSLVAHEFGHASATKYFNVPHGEMGFGIYMFLPVLYINVSNIWQLKRLQKAVVDIGGIYFQFFFLIPAILIWLVYRDNYTYFFIQYTNLIIFFNLNPFFKYDGYWLVSDLLGVPNLKIRINELIRYLISKIKKKQYKTKPFLINIPLIEKIFSGIYIAFMATYISYFYFYVIPDLYLAQFRTIVDIIETFSVSYQKIRGFIPVMEFFLKTIVMFIFFIFLNVFAVMIIKQIVGILKSWFSASNDNNDLT